MNSRMILILLIAECHPDRREIEKSAVYLYYPSQYVRDYMIKLVIV